jgi:hypothetical protein
MSHITQTKMARPKTPPITPPTIGPMAVVLIGLPLPTLEPKPGLNPELDVDVAVG